MKTFVAALLATAFALTAVPAFACDGHGSADKGDGDAVMTSVDEKQDDTKAKDEKKEVKKDAKKEDKAKSGAEA